MGQHRNRIRRTAGLGAIATIAFVACAALWAAPAQASVVWGCYSTPLGAAATPTQVDLTATFPKTDGTTGTTSLLTLPLGGTFGGSIDWTPGFDVDGDGYNDYSLNFQFHGGMYNYYSGGGLFYYRNLAIYNAGLYSQIFPLLNTYRGVDYSTLLTEASAAYYGPYYTDAFNQQTYIAKVASLGGATMPEGAVNISVTIHTAAGPTTVNVGMDTTGSSGAATPFPAGIATTVFLDGEHHELAAAGVQTYSDATTVTPWSDLAVTAGFTSLGGNPTDLAFELGYDGELATSGSSYTSVGFPGSVAAVAEQDCATNPYDDVLVAYDETLTGGVAPDADVLLRSRQDSDADGTFDTTTTFFDAAISGLSKALDARFWARDRDIDGDGAITSADVSDVDGDGINDLPWNGISLTHEGDQAMGIDATFASQSMDPTADLALRIDADTLQANPDLTFDYFGPVIEVDADEDGVGDDLDGDGFVDITTDLQQGRVRFCEVDVTVDGCSAGTETVSDELAVAYTNDFTPDGDGNVAIAFPTLGAAPQQLVDTQAGHVDPSDPDHWVRYEDTESTGARSIAGLLSGIRQGAFHTVAGDTNDDLRVTLDTTGLGEVGVEGLMHDADGSEMSAWGFVNDVPDTLDVTVDADGTDVDGDAVLAELHGSTRTAVGFEVDSDSTRGSASHSIIAGWLGTNDGTADGLPTDVKVTADLVSDTSMVVANSSSLAATIGLTTSDATDRSMTTDIDGDGDLEVMRTRALVKATIPAYLEAFVGENMDRVEVEACRVILMGLPVCNTVRDIAGTAVHEMGDEADPALPGVSMLPIPSPKAGVFQDPAGADFAPNTEFAHYVAYDDAVADQGGAPAVSFSPWGTEFSLSQLTRLGYARSNPLTLFRQTDVCATATTAGQRFGVGVFADSADPETDPIWLNGEVTHEATNPSKALNLQAQADLPDEDWGELGALHPVQLAVASTYPLLEEVQRPCPAFDSAHVNDVAPLPATGAKDNAPDLSLQLRSGSYAEVQNEIYALESPMVTVPAPGTHGLDAALYSSESYAAADIGGRIDLPGWLEVQQPVATTCRPEGNQDLSTCLAAPVFDQEYTTQVGLKLASNGSDFGDLDAEILVDSDDVLDGGPVLRVDARLDEVPGSFTVDGQLKERPRDGYMEPNLTVRDDTARNLEPVTVEVRDELHPARFGAEDEPDADDPMNEGVPNYRGYLYNLRDSLTLRAKVFLPHYGPDLPAYEGGADCSGTFGRPEDDDNIFPSGENPKDWVSDGPRTDEAVRPMYVHAEVDMNQGARTVDLLLDARVDSTRSHRSYDNLRNAAKVSYTSDASTNVDVWALYPGVRANMDTDAEWLGITVGRMESCIDIDVPIHLELDAATRLSGGLDLLALALTMDEGELGLGAHANVSFEERFWDVGGGWAALSTVDGVWVEELLTYTSALFDEYANKVTDSRMDVAISGFLSSGSFMMTTSTANEIDTDWVTDFEGLGSWVATDVDAAGDERYMGAFALMLFHPDIAEEIQDDGFGDWFDQWFDFNQAFDDSTDYLVDMTCGAGACGSFVDGPQTRWSTPTLDRSAAISNSRPATLTGASACGGSTSLDVVDSANFGRLSDGTELELSMHTAGGHGDGGRAEVYLIGHYDAGGGGSGDDVRFVQELFDEDTAVDVTTYCWQWRVSVSSLTIDTQGSIEMTYNVERRRRWYLGWWGAWTSFRSQTVLLDATGNMGVKSGSLSAPSLSDADGDGAVEATAGSPVSFSTTDAEGTRDACSFHPGDGTRFDQGETDGPWASGDTTWEHTYLVPGTYAAMVFCHDEQATVGPGTAGNHEPTTGKARKMTIEVS